jgi:citrate synthase
MWLSAAEALKRLGSKPQSLYANVSRGRIRARPDPTDARRSQYLADDVERLAGKARGRRPSASVAAEAVDWGEPLFKTAISTVVDGRLIYRGQDAVVLAGALAFEDVAERLLETPLGGLPTVGSHDLGIPNLLLDLAGRLGSARPSLGMSRLELRAEAADLLGLVTDKLAGPDRGDVAARLARRWKVDNASAPISRALVLLADHELNPSTFAARVTVSTGAPLAAGMLAGLGALLGPRHGMSAGYVSALADDLGATVDAESSLRNWLGEGRVLPGFGHRLYPLGDVRARALLDAFEAPNEYKAFERVGRELTGEAPNVDFALSALASAFNLPKEAPLTLFALARSAGWLAHMIEQLESGQLIRPRARYVRHNGEGNTTWSIS